MAKFNFRGLITTRTSPAGFLSHTVDIYEVYYNEKGRITMRSTEPVAPYACFEEDIEEGTDESEMMRSLHIGLSLNIIAQLKNITELPLMRIKDVDAEIEATAEAKEK